MARISVTVSDMIFILENVNTFSGTWYAATDMANVLFSLPVLKQHLKKFAFCGKGLQYAFTVLSSSSSLIHYITTAVFFSPVFPVPYPHLLYPPDPLLLHIPSERSKNPIDTNEIQNKA